MMTDKPISQDRILCPSCGTPKGREDTCRRCNCPGETRRIVCRKPISQQAARALLVAAESALAYFDETRAGRQWQEQGGPEPKRLRAAIAACEKGK